jgi:TonB family protein
MEIFPPTISIPWVENFEIKKGLFMKLIKVTIIFSVLISTLLFSQNGTEIQEIMQADSTKLMAYKTMLGDKIYFHDKEGYIIALNEKDKNWYYTVVSNYSGNDHKDSIPTDYIISNLKFGVNDSLRINLIKEYAIDGVEFFNIYPPPPPPPPIVEEEVFDFFPISENPEILPDSKAEMQIYIDNNYPPLAQKSGVSGKVIVKFIVSKKGIATSISIVSEKPYDMGFGEVAVKAVEKLKFKPAMQRDYAVPVRGKIKVLFQ